MARLDRVGEPERVRSPRTRGDGPVPPSSVLAQPAFSPHTRGWPGVDSQDAALPPRSPRTRGDGPDTATYANWQDAVLPAHAGMARVRKHGAEGVAGVLPAHAGMARH